MSAPVATPALRVYAWVCPNCKAEERTDRAMPNRYHQCPRLRGVIAPMLPAGTRAKVELREREDYVGGELVQLDPERRRPVMSVVTVRDDGQDVQVFAPAARLGVTAGMETSRDPMGFRDLARRFWRRLEGARRA